MKNMIDELWLPSEVESRSISAENPRGDKAGGARTKPDKNSPAYRLGKGWKVKPCIPIPAKKTAVIAEIKGAGVIRHIWMTLDPKFYRTCIIQIYWDNEKNPSVEVPLGDFFCCGHELRCIINSSMVSVCPEGGLNSYWPMPFLGSARIVIKNESEETVPMFFYQIDYSVREKLPKDIWYFHAQWRRENPVKPNREYTILDGVLGRGRYVGTYLAWIQLHPFWWGEGEIKFFIDGDKEFPTICGTGTEDYFGGAWCFNNTFSHIYSGYPLWLPHGSGKEEDVDPRVGIKHGLYRWHILDPIFFHNDLRVTIQALGWNKDDTFRSLEDDIASTAYWYQNEPHASRHQTL